MEISAKRSIYIKSVAEGSIAEEAGIEKGDCLLEINGSKVQDIIEYRFLTSDEELLLVVRKPDGEEWEIEIEKDFDEELGIDFDDPIMDGPQRCHNKCMFCFIDQLPPGMRETLYFKDDDSRMSFLQGNFVTLTNMSDEDIDRIIRYRISPINVSVHTTNPELRITMLNNKNAGKIMERLNRLTENGINLNCQIVLVPGVNDGKELLRTITDLNKFYPQIANVAIVPVGITRYREGLYDVKGFDRDSSSEVINLLRPLQEKIIEETGEPFARLADEFYLMADRQLPSYDHYGDFEQLEDGIGMIRYFENRITEDLQEKNINGKGKAFAIVTGSSSYEFMKAISKIIENKTEVSIEVYMVNNDFFGGKITVVGLITAGDIIKQLKGKIKEEIVFIPASMLKADEDVFLDDITLKEFQDELGKKVVKCKYTGDDFIEKLINEVIECRNQ